MISGRFNFESESARLRRGSLNGGTIVTRVIVDVSEAWDGEGASMQVGLEDLPNALMRGNQVDLSKVGTYIVQKPVRLEAAGRLYVTLDNGTAEHGRASVFVEVVRA